MKMDASPLKKCFRYAFGLLNKVGLLKWLPSPLFLHMKYYAMLGKRLNLYCPKTFNEKLQWIKLHDHNPEYTKMVDKALVKELVADRIGEKYIIPTLGVWKKFNEIDFDSLPEKFVLKCTHDSGGLLICKDKRRFDKCIAEEKITKSLKREYYHVSREWPYKNVKPRIIAEQYMEDEENKGDLSDYKIHCFNGEPRVVQVFSGRFSDNGMIIDHYDLLWNKLDIARGQYAVGKESMSRPAELDEMLDLARKLSVGIPYLRTDFYIVNHQIYFGELTFFPASGFRAFTPEKWDRIWGEWIKLPTDNITE